MKRSLSQKDVIALLPTGAGKSLTYQLSALLQPGIALIVDPLKSLMRDQNDNLLMSGIDSTAFINSSLNLEEREEASEKMTRGVYKYIFISPERLQIDEFRKKLLRMPERGTYFNYCVVDEAHCVSEWGHDFRTSYLRLGINAREYCKRYDGSEIPIMALTGTASFDVLSDVQRELQIEDDKAIISPSKYAREELIFEIINVGEVDLENNNDHFIIMKSVAELKQARLHKLLREIPDNDWSNGDHYESLFDFFDINKLYTNTGIIFCPHVSDKTGFGVQSISPEIQEAISELRGLTGIYAGSLEDENADQILEEIQNKFKRDELALLVATKAFGMGIDKPNLRFTVHFNMPQSIESFYQEAGRAGRDRDKAYCYILYSTTNENGNTLDKNLMMSFHQNSFPGIDKEFRIVSELLDEIKYPNIKQVDELSEAITAEFGRELKLNLWQKKGDRLYLNTDQYPQSYGYIELNSYRVYAEYRDSHKIADDESAILMLNDVLIHLKKLKPEGTDLLKWVEFQEIRQPENGIERLLSAMNEGEVKSLSIGFANDIIQIITEKLADSDDAWTEDMVEKSNSYCYNHEEFIRKLSSNYKNKTKRFKNFSNSDKDFFEENFYKIRGQADTFKAIYRLSILGVIDDYDIDYKGKLINVKIIKKNEHEYVSNLQKYIRRYVSREIAENVPNETMHNEGNSLIQKCLHYLIEFVYKNIAAKRKTAINIMDESIYEGIDDSSVFIDRVNSYFDSKYTVDLKRDIKNQVNIETVWLYMEKTKGERDSINHLRGSCDRLLVEIPDHPVLLLLRAFSRFLLPTSDKSLAIRDMDVGFQGFQDLKDWNRKEYLNYLSKYYEICIRYDNTIGQYLDQIIANAHTKWLKLFNTKFAEGVHYG